MSKYQDAMYRRSQRVEAKINDLYSRARAFKLTHDDILAQLQGIRGSADYRKLSAYYRGRARGIEDTLSAQLYRHDLVWRLGPASGPLPEAVDGWRLSSCCQVAILHGGRKCPVCERETPDTLFGTLARAKELYGGHFWAGTDKPFNGYKPI